MKLNMQGEKQLVQFAYSSSTILYSLVGESRQLHNRDLPTLYHSSATSATTITVVYILWMYMGICAPRNSSQAINYVYPWKARQMQGLYLARYSIICIYIIAQGQTYCIITYLICAHALFNLCRHYQKRRERKYWKSLRKLRQSFNRRQPSSVD